MDFIIDTTGEAENFGEGTQKENTLISSLLQDYKLNVTSSNEKARVAKPSIIDNFFEEMQWNENQQKHIPQPVPSISGSKDDVKSALEKSAVIKSDFEKLHTVPPYQVTEKKARELRKKEAEGTKGKKWYGLPATEVTEEIKHDLELLQMRSVLDPKRFYKKNDLKVIPKYFQIGKVMDSPLDYYNNRMTKKERKKTLVEELLADSQFRQYNKRKYKEIIDEKSKTHYKAWRKAKKLKKKK